MDEEEKIPKMYFTVSFDRRLSVAEKLKVIKYTEERGIHAVTNYYNVSRPAIRYWIKEKSN